MTGRVAWGRAWRPRYGALALALASCFLASKAAGRPEYPGELQVAAGMECPAPCKMCHLLPTGGKNWNPFGLRFVPHTAAGSFTWPRVLAALRQPDKDSDGDSRLDMTELDQGTDPSQASHDQLDCPRYGCGAHIAATEQPSPVGSMLALGAAWLLMRGSRRRRGQTSKSPPKSPPSSA